MFEYYLRLMLSAIFVLSSAAVRAQDQLLPEGIKALVDVTIAQEGRTLELAISNRSKFVITAGKLKCNFQEHGAPLDNEGFNRCLKRTPQDRQIDCFLKFGGGTNQDDFPVELPTEFKLLPGKTGTVFQQFDGTKRVAYCSAQLLRGREKRFYEF